MAGQTRPTSDCLERRLEEAPWAHDFFQAVRRIECADARLPRIGCSRHPREDPVRFSQEPSLDFAPSTIEKFTAGAPARMTVRFLGLLGPNGPMPLCMTEYARNRVKHAYDTTLASFLDIFNNRMTSLFYRAWAVAQQTVSYDRPGDDPFSDYICSLFGMGMASLRRRDAVHDLAKVHYAGHLVCKTRHAEGLRAILRDYFGIAVEIREFIGQWMKLPHDSQCRLGETPDTGVVGATAIVGSKIWECQQKFRIRFGPMGLTDYERMLPGGGSLARLMAWVRNYSGEELGWDVQLVLRAEEVPQVRLGEAGRLGWTTWLRGRPFTQDADDLILRPQVA
jgi:type VI secretion system protein ImpH